MTNLENNTNKNFIDGLIQNWKLEDKRFVWFYLDGATSYMDENDENWGDIIWLMQLIKKELV